MSHRGGMLTPAASKVWPVFFVLSFTLFVHTERKNSEGSKDKSDEISNAMMAWPYIAFSFRNCMSVSLPCLAGYDSSRRSREGSLPFDEVRHSCVIKSSTLRRESHLRGDGNAN